ncbi:SH3 domain-containing protein [Salinisphaera sp. T31B1]|uniref:SH3 domain-containing protein n=1 Tax=Salinisphaera sp. T31B1 TaxID=727963 RepID=UPI00333EFDEB
MNRAWLGVALLALSGWVGGPALAAENAAAAAFTDGDYATAGALWRPAAEAGDAQAQYGLGLLYANGWGVPQDPLAAQRWYGLAAERGLAAAQYNLAVMRETGHGVPRDVAEAGYWYTEAAAQGLSPAARNLALMILGGDGLERDPARAVKWLARSDRSVRARLIASLPSAHTIGRANLRAEPRIGSRRLTTLAGGQSLPVFARRDGWAQIWQTDTDRVGWVAESLLRGLPTTGAPRVALSRLAGGPLSAIDPTSAESAMTTTRATTSDSGKRRLLRNSGWLVGLDTGLAAAGSGRRMRVASARLNVRDAPGMQAAIVGRLAHDDIVRVLATRAGWRQIALPDGGRGWVAGFLLAEPASAVDTVTPRRGPKPHVGAVTASERPPARQQPRPASIPIGQGGG